MEYPDVPEDLLRRVRSICLALPEAYEVQTAAWPGSEFRIGRRAFTRVFTVTDPEDRDITMIVCRADPDEREALLAIGHPFFPARSGVDRIGVVLEDGTDWTELAELVTESYRLLAPKKLASRV